MSIIYHQLSSVKDPGSDEPSGKETQKRSQNHMGSKIGIILAFILSLAAAAGAFLIYGNLSSERNTRQNIEQKYEEFKEKVLTLESEREQIKAAKDQFQAESEEFQKKAETAENQLFKFKADASRVSTERLELERELEEKNNRLVEMESKVQELQRQAEEAMRACKVTPADIKPSLTTSAPVIDSSMISSSQSGPLIFSTPSTSKTTTPVPGVTSASSEPSFAGSTSSATVPVTAAPTPSPVEVSKGPRILTVNRRFNFVVLNLGLKDGLKMGDQLKVIKPGLEPATIQVEKLYDKFSAATIITEDSQNQIKEGDEILRS